MDYFNYFSNDWFSYSEIKIKVTSLNIFLNKKILIYGLGKTGLSALEFLKNKAKIFVHDDHLSKFKNLGIKNTISYKNLLKLNFDQIILSPGIDLNKCKLSKFLKKKS